MLQSDTLASISDDELLVTVQHLTARSNVALAELLAHLGEVERRGIHRLRACASLYTYCIYELRMSEDAAYRRAKAARLVREYPELRDAIAKGEIHLTGVLMIAPHLGGERHAEILRRARFRSKRELLRLIAEIDPKPEVPALVEPIGPGPVGRATWAAFMRALEGPFRELPPGQRPEDWIMESIDSASEDWNANSADSASEDWNANSADSATGRHVATRERADFSTDTGTRCNAGSTGCECPRECEESKEAAAHPQPEAAGHLPALRYKVQVLHATSSPELRLRGAGRMRGNIQVPGAALSEASTAARGPGSAATPEHYMVMRAKIVPASADISDACGGAMREPFQPDETMHTCRRPCSGSRCISIESRTGRDPFVRPGNTGSLASLYMDLCRLETGTPHKHASRARRHAARRQ